LLVRLLVGLHVVEVLQYNLHQIVLGGNQLLEVIRLLVLVLLGCPLH
jgi:hypothetical protein